MNQIEKKQDLFNYFFKKNNYNIISDLIKKPSEDLKAIIKGFAGCILANSDSSLQALADPLKQRIKGAYDFYKTLSQDSQEKFKAFILESLADFEQDSPVPPAQFIH